MFNRGSLAASLVISSGIFTLIASSGESLAQSDKYPSELLFGDTHLHTSYSFDAFLNQNKSADPDTAYRWAKGLPVVHPYTGARVQIKTPLDFLVVSDHAEGMGVVQSILKGEDLKPDAGMMLSLKRMLVIRLLKNSVATPEGGFELFSDLMPRAGQNPGSDPITDPNHDDPNSRNELGDTSGTQRVAWHEIVDAAEHHNDPGKFTSFIGWEWSSVPTGANLHRVVFTPDGGDKARQFRPFGSDQGEYPEQLWNFLDETSKKTGARFVAIPHNSNISKGYMFAETTLKGRPITQDYARTRVNWEPVVEVTQVKGDSETHPSLSPDDEFADFENYTNYIQKGQYKFNPQSGDFIRSALKTGIQIEQKIGANPYKFGMIGSTDSHTGLSTAEEDNFLGKYALDSIPAEKRRSGQDGEPISGGWKMAAAGLAAVWAKENTREEIYAAFKRREVYATTGSRMAVRMFGGWNFEESMADAEELPEIGYNQGVPMGSDLPPSSMASTKAPSFLIRATKDPIGANLDRVQIIKGWVDENGKQYEKVYNVSWSGDRNVNPDGKLPPVGNTVDLKTGGYTNDIGQAELSTVWQDPDFNNKHHAFYYARVLEIPTPRHSLLDGLALKINTPKEGPATLQERAYTSPIWFTPNS
ncbi:DUF3604 domain-containing protein [Flexibacterium corallicola]|uniref:DUF3604 domain-containing protein n=1 Tax=Flexibacterium corallicola TaxID=3037259 RepID=UPI00286F39E2|nr:DUF3604 domain-containing protein [Pseudovibrio sp. M1P-2-3]